MPTPPPSPSPSPPPSPSPSPSPPSRGLALSLARPTGLWSSLAADLPEQPRLLRPHLVHGIRGLCRRRRTGLPLPIHRNLVDAARITREMFNSFAILEDIVHQSLSILHVINTSLLYWDQYTYQGTDLQKICFMAFQRGPRKFAQTVLQTLARLRPNGSPLEFLVKAASDIVSIHRAALTTMQRCMSTFLAEVYFEVDEHMEELTESSDKSLKTLCVVLNTTFLKLEAAIGIGEPIFRRLPKVDPSSSDWPAQATQAILFIYENLQKLEGTVTSQISSHIKPSNIAIYWLPYTCGVIGLSASSLWLLSHSSWMGCSDISDWIQDAKGSMTGFWDQRVQKPIISIKDEVMRTLNRSDRHTAVEQDVKSTEESLNRMLVDFCKDTPTQETALGRTPQDMLGIVMKTYEEETRKPMNNLFFGEIGRTILIQIQKLKLDFKEAMLELDQILKANEINLAILAALPLLGTSLMLLLLVKAGITHVTSRRSRITRRHLWAILNEIGRLVSEFEEDKAERWKFGLAIYSTDRLYGMIEPSAKETEELIGLSKDLFALTRPNNPEESKVAILQRLKECYICLQKPFTIDHLI